MTLSIGAYGLDFYAPQEIALSPHAASYRNFIGKHADLEKGIHRVRVHVELGDVAVESMWQEVFSSDESWTLFRSQKDYVWVLQRRGDKTPFCSCRLADEQNQVYVRCLPEAVQGPEIGAISNPLNYPLDQLLMGHLLSRDGFGMIVHGACAVIDDHAYIFAGKSGAGKTTLSLSIREHSEIKVVNDDRAIITKHDGRFVAWGSPWCGDAKIAERIVAPLSGIMMLEHGSENRIVEQSQKGVGDQFLAVASVPWYDETLTAASLAFCDDLLGKMRLATLEFLPGQDVADTILHYVRRGL